MLDVRRSCCIFSNTFSECELVELLEPSSALQASITSASEHNHWSLVDHGFCHPRYAVSHAGPGDSQHHPWPAGKVANYPRSIGCGLLVSEAEILQALAL